MKIPVYRPYLHGKERQYVNECLDSSWISSKGEFIGKFEKEFQKFVGRSFASSVCNGTVALHLALLALGIGPGDEVIVPTLTYVASANAAAYVGATPIFVDALPTTWQMDPEDVKRKISKRTKAIIVVHLYGHPCDMKTLKKIADQNDLYLIEDCAEAFGSYFQGAHVGSWGDLSTFSFFGNKTITTGEGGMVVTDDPALFQRVSLLKNQGNSPGRSYWHEEIGYNYRMTNLAAAIGLAQIEQTEVILQKKREIAIAYKERLDALPVDFHAESDKCKHSYWMVSVLAKDAALRDPLRDYLLACGIETRPLFVPINQLPIYQSKTYSCPIAEDLSSRGINLPSFPDLTIMEIDFICEQIKAFYCQKTLCYSAAADTLEVLPISF